MPPKKPSPKKYASGTEVPIERSQAEIRKLLEKYGVVSGFVAGEYNGMATLMFEMNGKRIRFSMGVPRVSDGDLKNKSEAQKWAYVSGETRRLWRAMALCIKAKCESVASEIETFEDAFMAQTVMPSGETIGEWVHREENQMRISSGKMPPLLPGPSK